MLAWNLIYFLFILQHCLKIQFVFLPIIHGIFRLSQKTSITTIRLLTSKCNFINADYPPINAQSFEKCWLELIKTVGRKFRFSLESNGASKNTIASRLILSGILSLLTHENRCCFHHAGNSVPAYEKRKTRKSAANHPFLAWDIFFPGLFFNLNWNY